MKKVITLILIITMITSGCSTIASIGKPNHEKAYEVLQKAMFVDEVSKESVDAIVDELYELSVKDSANELSDFKNRDSVYSRELRDCIISYGLEVGLATDDSYVYSEGEMTQEYYQVMSDWDHNFSIKRDESGVVTYSSDTIDEEIITKSPSELAGWSDKMTYTDIQRELVSSDYTEDTRGNDDSIYTDLYRVEYSTEEYKSIYAYQILRYTFAYVQYDKEDEDKSSDFAKEHEGELLLAYVSSNTQVITEEGYNNLIDYIDEYEWPFHYLHMKEEIKTEFDSEEYKK